MSRNLIPRANKELRPLLRELVSQGWTISITGGNHLRVLSPDGGKPIFMSSTPSDRRAHARIVSFLRRAGFVWPV